MPCFFLGYALVLSPLLKVTRDFLESGEPECQSRKMWGFISSLFFLCVAYFPGEFSHIAESAFIFLSRTSLLLNITERERISSYVSPLFVWTHLVHFVCCSNSKCRKFQSLAVLANSLTQSTTYFHESSLGNRWNMSLAGRWSANFLINAMDHIPL